MLRIAYPNSLPIKNFDPASINTTGQANIVRALFRPLVDFDRDANLVGGVADSFEWHGNQIHFHIRNGLKTVDGIEIDAMDAEISLKRLLIKASNTHGDLHQFLCPNIQLKSLSDNCDEIQSNGKTLILTPASPAQAQFLVPLLASTDFVVIPKSSIDLQNPDLPIIGYRNTSGAYYLEKDDPTGAFVFQANPHNYLYNNRMAQRVQFVPVPLGDKALELLESGQVDFVPTIDSFSPGKIEEIESNHDMYSVHKTMDIKTWALFFTRSGVINLSDGERRFIGTQVRKAFSKSPISKGLIPSFEFFPKFGDGSLTPDQVDQVKQLYQSRITDPARTITVATTPGRKLVMEKLFQPFNFIKVVVTPPPWTLPVHEMPDMYIMEIDSAFNEDVSLISYNLKIGSFGLDSKAGARWLDEYMSIKDRSDRLNKLRNLHFQFLSQASIVPLAHGPYMAFARKPWKIEFSRFFAGSPLWQVTHN